MTPASGAVPRHVHRHQMGEHVTQHTTCQETCRCADGLVLDGGECVDPAQCGCTTENGVYIPVSLKTNLHFAITYDIRFNVHAPFYTFICLSRSSKGSMTCNCLSVHLSCVGTALSQTLKSREALFDKPSPAFHRTWKWWFNQVFCQHFKIEI